MFRPTKIRAFPVPREYQRVHLDLHKFLETARDLSGIETTHRAYTMCQGVFQVFRKRLTLEQSIRFANTLPAGIRALYVADWDPDPNASARVPFMSKEKMTLEVQKLRPSHNYAPNTALQDVAKALRQVLEDETKFDNVLKTVGPEALDFWKVQ